MDEEGGYFIASKNVIDLFEREIVVGPYSYKTVNDTLYKRSKNKLDAMQPVTKNAFYDVTLSSILFPSISSIKYKYLETCICNTGDCR